MNLVLRITLLLPISCAIWTIDCQHVEGQRHMTNQTNIRHSFCEVQSAPKKPTLVGQSSSILYGLLKKLNASYVDDVCNEHLQLVYDGINRKESWAMKGLFNIIVRV